MCAFDRDSSRPSARRRAAVVVSTLPAVFLPVIVARRDHHATGSSSFPIGFGIGLAVVLLAAVLVFAIRRRG